MRQTKITGSGQEVAQNLKEAETMPRKCFLNFIQSFGDAAQFQVIYNIDNNKNEEAADSNHSEMEMFYFESIITEIQPFIAASDHSWLIRTFDNHRETRALPRPKDIPIKLPDEAWKWTRFHLLPHQGDRNSLNRSTRVIITNITDDMDIQVRLARANEQLTAALESASQAVWDLDFVNNRTYYSPAWTAMLGFGPDDIPDDPDAWEQLIHPDDVEAVLEQDRAHKEGRIDFFKAEFRMRHKNGSWIWILDRGKVLARDKNGKPLRMIGTHTDITERKHTLAELEDARKRAEAAASAKADFLANMSHELRTPLTSIIGATDLLADELKDVLSKRLLSVLSMQEEAGHSLLGIVNDILDFSKLETGDLRLETIAFDLKELVKACLAMVRPTAERKRIHLTSSGLTFLPSWLTGDPLRLRQILINLLSNAIKFTPDGGSVTIRVKRTREGRIEFSVEDTGIGISQENLAKLFNRFSQADSSTTREYGGSGLGLAITKRLVDMMDGNIGVDSTPGSGTTFWFDLPMILAEGRPETDLAQAGSSSEDLNGRNILLAEDNLVNQRLIRMTLEKSGCQVTVVSTGAAAVEAIENSSEETYDLILMDIQMPQMDGPEAARLIRGSERGRKLPIIALTANVFAESHTEGADWLFDAWQAKPVDWPELCRTMGQLLGDRRLPSEGAWISPPPTPSAAAPEPAPSSEAPEPAPQMPDQFADLVEIFGAEEVARLASLFCEELQQRLTAIAAVEGDPDRIAREAHALASAAASLEFRDLSACCRQIMAMADSDASRVPELVQELDRLGREAVKLSGKLTATG